MTMPGRGPAGARGAGRSPPGVTFLVGENGSGKSTLVEAVAMAYGLAPEGGSTRAPHSTRASESALVRRCGSSAGSAPAAGGSSCAPRRCTAGTPTSRRPRAARRPGAQRPALPRDEPRRVVPRGAARPASTRPASTASTSRRRRCRSPRRWAWSRCCTTWCWPAARSSARRTPPCSPPCPAPPSSRSGDWGLRETDLGRPRARAALEAYLDAPDRYLRHVLAD